jgi:hypothetical protein
MMTIATARAKMQIYSIQVLALLNLFFLQFFITVCLSFLDFKASSGDPAARVWRFSYHSLSMSADVDALPFFMAVFPSKAFGALSLVKITNFSDTDDFHLS